MIEIMQGNPKLRALQKRAKELGKKVPGSDALTYGEMLERAMQNPETSAEAADILDSLEALRGD